MENAANENHRRVKSADRTLVVLEHLASVAVPRTFGELARELGIPKSSLHAILRTMQDRGWIEEDTTGTRFSLGVRALLVGASYIEADDVVSLTEDVLNILSDELGETIHLGRLDGGDIVYLAKRESVHPLRLFSAIGRRLPAHATALGKAVLSMRDRDDLQRMLPKKLPALTQNTITHLNDLERELQQTRDRGYAIDNEENTPGIRCIAVPLRHGGPVTDAISCSVPVMRLTPHVERDLVASMLRARDRAEARLGLR